MGERVNIGERLKEFRHSLNLSQQQFAEAIGTTQQCVSNYERGVSEPSVEMLLKVSRVFHSSLDEILGETENKLDREVLAILSKMPESKKKLSKKILETIGNES